MSKYAIARKEARETHYWLRLLAATGLERDDQIKPMLEECNELIAILTTIIKSAHKNRELK